MSVDYAFMNEKGEEQSMPILILLGRKGKYVGSDVVQNKGMSAFANGVLKSRLLFLKCDQESPIVALKHSVIDEGVVGVEQLMSEESPVGGHASNGEIEQTVGAAKGQVRAWKSALEATLGVRVGREDSRVPWLVMHAAGALNRGQVFKDGKTAWERARGKTFKKYAAYVEGSAWYLKLGTLHRDQWHYRWGKGVWLDFKDESGESYIWD